MTTYNMSDIEYKQYICDICNRIISEKIFKIIKDESCDNNNLVLKIQILPKEWYMELDDDLKFNVEYNLQELFKPKIIEAMNEYDSNLNQENNYETHKNKKQKT